MTKREFLEELLYEFRQYPREDIYGFLDYYTEQIDDRVEEGMTEEEAVASLGSVQTIASQIKAELSRSSGRNTNTYERKRGKLPAWAILLLVLGSPIWLSLLIAAGAVLFSVLIVIWSVVIAFWALEFAFGIGSLVCILAGIVMLTKGSFVSAAIYFGGTLLLAGLAIFGTLLFTLLTKGGVALSKGLFQLIRKCFNR